MSITTVEEQEVGVTNNTTQTDSMENENGMRFRQVFSSPGQPPFDSVEWDSRTAEIADGSGKAIFKQENVEVPKTWSELATKIAVSKYFYGDIHSGTDPRRGGREHSIKQLIHRVTRTITDWGIKDGYFASNEDAEAFYNDLTWLCLHQFGAFNSPVWFNVGLYHQYGTGKNSAQGNFYWNPETKQAERSRTQYEYPQCSACFIQSVEDNMESILRLAHSEAMLFKFGSGSGTDLSPIRSSREKLSGGGVPSGPLSFLRVYDQIANVVKSGGKTRRAAKMNTLKDWHPDVEEFIRAKAIEEKKAWALIEQGYDGSFNGDAYASVMFQNENLSVRVSDKFMEAATNKRDWWTRAVTSGEPVEKKNAHEMLHLISEGTWLCGDPGIQFDDTIHRWHTCKGTDRQHSTNPCSEYLFLNDTACNLSSLNLVKFKRPDGSFDIDRFKTAIRIFITAQEILVDNACYPTASITVNSHLFRTLGLGYANLGSLIMSYGHGYDSDEGRGLAGALTAILTGTAYQVSAELSKYKGPFAGYRDARAYNIDRPLKSDNVDSMLDVIELHRSYAKEIHPSCPAYLRQEAQKAWDKALEQGRAHGYRNAQVTVLAPTGTIGFLMDCNTTGIEPDIALVKYKVLAGGGVLKIVNNTVTEALKNLGYSETQARDITEYIDQNDMIEGAPHLKDEHLSVFDCAFKPAKGRRFLSYRAHIHMMAAVQPFISGAISKTVNMPNEATVEDILNTYIEGWKLGLKALAIYREGSKRAAPLSTKKTEEMGGKKEEADIPEARPIRRRMPDTRQSITHKFDIAGHEGYLTVGLFEANQPGELFVTMAKEGSTIGGLMDTIGTLVSMALQYGVPIDALIKKFAHSRFEPSGFTKNPDIPMAKSIPDYIFRWLGNQFLPGYKQGSAPHGPVQPELPIKELKEMDIKAVNKPVKELPISADELTVRYKDGIVCPDCGSSKVRHTGTCATCLNCGASLGCS
ncbi:MAG: vitamin B12-dependent ribonucleotide reductase [Verrucomicrobiae bacterium]|nr:vitamin B12-dependent ribonucleotide reductase [Verrucomicrobiae bacterium]